MGPEGFCSNWAKCLFHQLDKHFSAHILRLFLQIFYLHFKKMIRAKLNVTKKSEII